MGLEWPHQVAAGGDTSSGTTANGSLNESATWISTRAWVGSVTTRGWPVRAPRTPRAVPRCCCGARKLLPALVLVAMFPGSTNATAATNAGPSRPSPPGEVEMTPPCPVNKPEEGWPYKTDQRLAAADRRIRWLRIPALLRYAALLS